MRWTVLTIAVILAGSALGQAKVIAGKHCDCQQCTQQRHRHAHCFLEAPPSGPVYGSAPAVMAPVMFVPPGANADDLRLNRDLVDQMAQALQRSLDASKKQQSPEKKEAAKAPSTCNGSSAPKAPANAQDEQADQGAKAAAAPAVPQLPSTEQRLTQIGGRIDHLSLKMQRLEALTVEALETMNARLRQVEQRQPGSQ